LGAGLVGVLKKPWAITAAAAAIVVNDHTDRLLTITAFVCFAAVSTATVGLMYGYYARSPVEAAETLWTLYHVVGRWLGVGRRGRRPSGHPCRQQEPRQSCERGAIATAVPCRVDAQGAPWHGPGVIQSRLLRADRPSASGMAPWSL
jgi:hypothetical protein